MDHTPIVPVATPEAFVALQRAARPDPATGKPDPAAMKAYLARHPETRAYQDYVAAAPLPDSFANSIYYSINAFRFIDGAGSAHARSEEHTSELQSLMRISYAVFCLKKKQ